MTNRVEADPQGRWEPLTPAEVGELFAAVGVPWWIAGGYSIEHAVGESFRAHGDIDVLLLRRDQAAAQQVLADWECWAADPPGSLRPWLPGETLPDRVHDIWCRPGPAEPWRLQLMLNDSEGDQWISRRDPRIRRSIASIGTTSDGITYLAPEIQLYFKAKGRRPKDEQDFIKTLPVLSESQRQWLRDAIALNFESHPWLDCLGGTE